MANNDLFNEITTRAAGMKTDNANRDSMYTELENMLLLEPKNLPSANWIKQTISPDPKNKLGGAQRLLDTTQPKWRVPIESNMATAKEKTSKLEKAAGAIWQLSRRVHPKLFSDIVLSALLYSEVHISITDTRDLADFMKGQTGSLRAEDIAKKTPVLFDVLPAKTGYSEFDGLGLAAYYQRQEMSVGNVRSRWGKMAAKSLGTRKANEKVILCDFWDDINHCVFIEGGGDPILLVEHKLPFIPVSVRLVEGTNLLTGASQQNRWPFLYTLWKSGIWERESLALTVIYSMMFVIGSNPMFVYRRNQVDKTINPDYSNPGGMINIDTGEDFFALAKQVIDPSLLTGLNIAKDLVEASTIYSQTLGEPLGQGNAPFSSVALLAQAGRLPLAPYKEGIGSALGNAMYMALSMLRDKGKSSIKTGASIIDLVSGDIPEDLYIEAELEVNLPQDERQNVVTALQATNGQKPLVSQRFAREKWLGVEQPDDMQTEIWDEEGAEMQKQLAMQQEMMKAMPQQGGPPGQTSNVPGGPGGNPNVMQPQDLQAMLAQQQQGGQAMPDIYGGSGQLPPEAMTSPVQPGQGQAASVGLPPELMSPGGLR